MSAPAWNTFFSCPLPSRFVPLLNGVNRAIHFTRRALAKQLFK